MANKKPKYSIDDFKNRMDSPIGVVVTKRPEQKKKAVKQTAKKK